MEASGIHGRTNCPFPFPVSQPGYEHADRKFGKEDFPSAKEATNSKNMAL